MPHPQHTATTAAHDVAGICERYYRDIDHLRELQARDTSLQAEISALEQYVDSDATYPSQGVASYAKGGGHAGTVSDPTPRAAGEHQRMSAKERAHLSALRRELSDLRVEAARLVAETLPITNVIQRLDGRYQVVISKRWGVVGRRKPSWESIAVELNVDVRTIYRLRDDLERVFPDELQRYRTFCGCQ